jgi:hypothetical protein
MPEEQTRIRQIVWLELFPWLGLIRAVRLAFAPRIILLGAIGWFATASGWGLIGLAFPLPEQKPGDFFNNEGVATLDARPAPDRTLIDSKNYIEEARVPDESKLAKPSVSISVLDPATSEAQKPWNLLSYPFRKLFESAEITLGSFVYLLLCGVWGLLVWSIFGAAISRTAALWFAREDRLGFLGALLWGVKKWPAYCGGPIFPLLGILLAVVPAAFLGLLLKLDIGVFLVGIIWPVVLLCGFFIAILLVGLLFGWPLMWPTVSAEGTDSFDALSRSYSYTYQRPVHYLFYAAVAGVLGMLAWVVVVIFADGVITYSQWAASWGSGAARMNEIYNAGNTHSGSGIFGVGADAIGFWIRAVRVIALGFLFGYFWSAATYIYFLLRQAVDATEMDEVAVEEEAEEYSLPPLKTEPGSPPPGFDPPAAS